ncbi:Uncharacterised protein [Campylobacter hyointestinalis]|nr:hypothetical protein [Campylobacter hyointestinalis]PPB51202.1 hypothetical protein CDQ68_08585 [Campylobacter hyointestinalis subsp. hyointestinalis]PPB55575.1 hypothetical protein CDQ67_05925 [Campylobacter hyointestinalis subsp. hyointestinalis]PPB65613.1 hypothetical protein CDQ75_08920 [Campylobacter hyointestinalis subsp. hyointestinalis]PPB68053.1 hypothetical protein CDQ77_08525 [Campylobacter hyointestinalis subsp. hyointestinalis]CUU81896.1 Uncharacterised protein [Campylobacter h
MKFISFLTIVIMVFFSNGCYFKNATYDNFKYKRDFFLIPHNSKIILSLKEFREIYDDTRYIYKFKGDDPRCHYGYLTNKDDKPERILEWIILSGKEYCKETPGIGTWI